MFILSIILFLFIHIFLWRYHRPPKPHQTLFKLALLVFMMSYSFSTWLDLLIFFLFFLFYLCFYSGIEEQSISLLMMRMVKNNPGISLDELKKSIPQNMLRNRTSLAKNVWFKEERLSTKGIILIHFFRGFRALAKLPLGG